MKRITVKKAVRPCIVALLALSVVFSAMGCSKKVETNGESSVSTSLPSGPVTLNIYHWTAESNMTDIINEFEKQYPNVKVVYHKMATSDHSISNPILASNTPVDAMAQGTIDDTRMRVANNIYTNLLPYMKADGIDMTKTYGSAIAGLETFSGKVYAMPYCRNIRGLLYNKDMFKKAGISYPNENWTWDDLRSAALKLTSGSGANKVYGIIPNYDDNAGSDWALLAQEALGPNYMYTKNGKVSNFTDPAVVKSLQYWYDLETKDKSAWPVSEYAALQIDSNPFVQFYEGKAAMLINPEYAIKYSATKSYNFIGFDYAVANIPKLKKDDSVTSLYYVTDYGIPANSKNKEYAWKFIKMYCIDRPDLAAGAKGQLPGPEMSSLSADMQKTLKDKVFNYPHFDVQSGVDTFFNAKAKMVSDNSTITTAKTEINTYVQSEVINCLEGNETPQQALNNMKQHCDALINQAG